MDDVRAIKKKRDGTILSLGVTGYDPTMENLMNNDMGVYRANCQC